MSICFRYVWLLLFLMSCQRDVQVDHAYYYWRSVYKIDNEIVSKINENTELYIKMFDVKWKSDQAVPVAIIEWADAPKKGIVPVVYITNEVMQKISENDIDSLAKNIVTLVRQKLSDYHHIQIDCDWSDRSREKYFGLLKTIKSLHHQQVVLSCTIRLHQLKFAHRTGVPPVDKGILMLYNMAALGDYKTVHSIYDERVIDTYLDDVKSYKLPLDLALAKYQQCVIFRNRQFVSTLRQPYFFDPGKQKKYFTHAKAWYYTCIRDTTIQNIHIAPGDQIRYEKHQENGHSKYIEKIARLNNSDSLKVVYFDIHS